MECFGSLFLFLQLYCSGSASLLQSALFPDAAAVCRVKGVNTAAVASEHNASFLQLRSQMYFFLYTLKHTHTHKHTNKLFLTVDIAPLFGDLPLDGVVHWCDRWQRRRRSSGGSHCPGWDVGFACGN